MANMDILSIISSENVSFDELVKMLFIGYKEKQASNDLYSKDDYVPQNLIKLYYEYIDEPRYNGLMTNFKKKYTKNESKLEEVHEKTEQDGLNEVYEYIHKTIKTSNLNIFILLRLHQILYSKSPFPEFGGTFRTMNVYLPGTGVDLSNWDEIPSEINKLYIHTSALIKRGDSLGQKKDSDAIIDYINDCVELNCRLIKIHPFMDGNGRTVRAFTNMLFKLAGIAPIYVKPDERFEYQQAMAKGINENNYESIQKFYYYKICDSILELDINERIEQEKGFELQKSLS